MPAHLSKFISHATCREYAHPWTDSCIDTTAGLGLHVLQESLRVYTTVYLVTLLMKGKIPSKEEIKKTLLGILQSTAFLSWSGFSYSTFICILRRVFGNFNFFTVSFLPSFLSSFTAILIERPSRRPLLCLYVSNVATETLFRMGVWRGYFSPIKRGETYIFAASVALLLYFYRSKTNNTDSIHKIFRILVGKYEGNQLFKSHPYSETSSYSSDSNISPKEKESGRNKKPDKIGFNILMKSFIVYKNIIEYIKAQSKHVSCPHPYSCAHYVLSGGAKLFSYGLCAQLALKIVLQFKKILVKPSSMKATIFKKQNLSLATFLGGFAGLYRLVSCFLRRGFDKDSHYFAIPAGLVASIAFTMYPDNTVALYLMWKALQLLWNDAVEKGIAPEVKWFVIFLYCFSTALLFHAAILEPQNLRTSYWRFLYNLSGGRIATMSRIPLDAFGLHSSKQLAEVLKKTGTTDKHVYSF